MGHFSCVLNDPSQVGGGGCTCFLMHNCPRAVHTTYDAKLLRRRFVVRGRGRFVLVRSSLAAKSSRWHRRRPSPEFPVGNAREHAKKKKSRRSKWRFGEEKKKCSGGTHPGGGGALKFRISGALSFFVIFYVFLECFSNALCCLKCITYTYKVYAFDSFFSPP